MWRSFVEQEPGSTPFSQPVSPYTRKYIPSPAISTPAPLRNQVLATAMGRQWPTAKGIWPELRSALLPDRDSDREGVVNEAEGAGAAKKAWQGPGKRMPHVHQLTLLDIKPRKTGIFDIAQKFVPRSCAPAGQVIFGARISAQNFQDFSGFDGVNCLLGFEQRHGATHSFAVQGLVRLDAVQLHVIPPLCECGLIGRCCFPPPGF